MAISSSFGFSRLPYLPHRYPVRRFVLQFSSQVRVGYTNVEALHDTEIEKGDSDAYVKVSDVWKKFKSKELGISNSEISKATRLVLNRLKKRGFEVYLVGGCVRDLILKKTPKDFDVITSAELREVVGSFPRCEMIGRRFPICHVHIGDTIVEVSSFSTRARRSKRDSSLNPEKPAGCSEKDFLRWKNCLQRDFTINGLMLDPYANLVYDYLGGVHDIWKAKVQTIKPANLSFTEDCARILRAVRIAARLGFRMSKETALAVKKLSSTILRLDKGRLLMEVNYMMAYGSAEASLRLLWKLGLLEILLPFQAAYFVRNGFRRRDKRYNMLLSLLANLDKHLTPDKPCHNSLWCALLVFHEGLSEQPRDPLVIAAFSLAVYNGGDIAEASNIARCINRKHDTSFHELLEPGNLDSDALSDEVRSLGDSVRVALHHMTDEYFVSQAMAEYPKAPHSDLVFFPATLHAKMVKIFECIFGRTNAGFYPKQGGDTDYGLLAVGDLKEVRYLFARVVVDTIYPWTVGLKKI